MTPPLASPRRALPLALALGPVSTGLPQATRADTIASTKGEQRIEAWITGYTYWDNSPPGSAAIARPTVHDKAGGIGTWEDPITLAVGRGNAGWHYPPGTRIYLEDFKKYAVVEDLCGACGAGRKGRRHFDLYLGGQNTTARAAHSCALKITAVRPVVVYPGPDYPVTPGEVAETCNDL